MIQTDTRNRDATGVSARGEQDGRFQQEVIYVKQNKAQHDTKPYTESAGKDFLLIKVEFPKE